MPYRTKAAACLCGLKLMGALMIAILLIGGLVMLVVIGIAAVIIRKARPFRKPLSMIRNVSRRLFSMDTTFEERVRRRAYFLWVTEGRQPGRAEYYWQTARTIQGAIEAEASASDPSSLTADIEELQFRSDLAEVQLLLDFVSGRPDKAFLLRASPRNTNPQHGRPTDLSGTALTKAVTTDTITIEELRQIATIRFPPNKSIQANADDAALLIAVRDKLNQLVRPASGLTVAFTLRTWTPWLSTHRGLGRDWARWKLANQAYPRLGRSVFRFQISAALLTLAAVVVTFFTVWLSNDVADGTAKLNRIRGFESERSALIDLIQQIETSSSAPNVLRDTGVNESGHPNSGFWADFATRETYVVRYCEKEKLIPQVSNDVVGDIQKFDSSQQYETCDKYNKLESQILSARSELRQWWADWQNSPISSVRCWIVARFRGHLDECEKLKVDTGGIISVSDVRPTQALPESDFAASQTDYIFPLAFDVLATLSNIWLPVLYGFIGAIVAAMRNIYQKVSTSTLAPWDTRLLLTRVVLGVMAGASVGLFFAPSGTNVQGSPGVGPLTLSAVAFLAGYSVEGLFSLLDEIINRVFRMAPDSAHGNK
jgi:hypothetical protein